MKVGRNDLCPCGNGKKYKKCCMRKDEALENRTTRQVDPVEIKQVDQIQQPLLTKPDLQQQPLKMNPESVIDKEDLSLMEEIGIPLEEAHQFYVKDILQCFKEKGAEKSQSTYYKYRLGLQTIGFFLSRRILKSWSDVNQNDWEKWLSYSYLVFNMDATVSQVKGFMAVLNSFIVQIDETYGTEHLPIVQKLVKELEPSVIASVKTIEAYSSYQERRNKPEYGLDYLWDMLHCAPIQTGDSVQGIFEIKESNEKTVNLQLLGADSQTYSIETSRSHLENIESAVTVRGARGQGAYGPPLAGLERGEGNGDAHRQRQEGLQRRHPIQPSCGDVLAPGVLGGIQPVEEQGLGAPQGGGLGLGARLQQGGRSRPHGTADHGVRQGHHGLHPASPGSGRTRRPRRLSNPHGYGLFCQTAQQAFETLPERVVVAAPVPAAPLPRRPRQPLGQPGLHQGTDRRLIDTRRCVAGGGKVSQAHTLLVRCRQRPHQLRPVTVAEDPHGHLTQPIQGLLRHNS